MRFAVAAGMAVIVVADIFREGFAKHFKDGRLVHVVPDAANLQAAHKILV